MSQTVKSFTINPVDTCLETLASSEINGLFVDSRHEIHDLLERCSLAVLNSGSGSDDVKALMEEYREFRLQVNRTAGGIELELHHVPEAAFVTYEAIENGHAKVKYKMIEGIRQHIFAVLRDLVFIKREIDHTGKFQLDTQAGIMDAVFMILRNAQVFEKRGHHKIIVCWGGHAIGETEYNYTVEVGHQCGLRFMDIITGCGAGAMKGPMEGATLAHARQRFKSGRYIGITEPGIISSEPPNPIVDPLIIMPDIEKRLEAFVRLGQGIVIFPGGVGTAEEIMYILSILTHPKNSDLPYPVILTGPKSGRAYFSRIYRFLENTLGRQVCDKFQLIIDDPEKVAQEMNKGLLEVKAYREKMGDSYYFNRKLSIPYILQQPFLPTHESVSRLDLHRGQETYMFAAQLRRVFSAIVAGNVKPEGIRQVEEHGPFQIRGDESVLLEIDQLLSELVGQGRMRLTGEYKPCYEIVS